MHIAATALLTVAALGSACRGPTIDALGDTPSLRTVEVVNHTGEPLRIARPHQLGGYLPPGRDLGDAEVTTLQLPAGRYTVMLGGERTHKGGVPLPLPKDPRIGSRPVRPTSPHRVRIEIWPWPAPDDGWRWIPAGIALRGDELGVGQEDERPLSTPFTQGFWLAGHETTNAQFVTFLNAVGSDAVDVTWLDLEGMKCRVQWDDATGAFATDAPDLPVVTVSWNGAIAYCDWRTEATGTKHRLPTETEWEKAARGPGSRVYAFGDVCEVDRANVASGRLREIGQYEPNGFGLHDMTGNAFEWCADVYRADAYERPAGTEPGTEPADPDAHRVLRGGSFVLDGIFCRNSMRMRLRPDVRADDVGFRVLRENTDAAFGPVPGR